MRLLASSSALAGDDGPYAMALGIFDGVHLGHRVLLEKARDLAAAEGIESLAYTFNPHPARVLAPQQAPDLLEPIEMRLDHFAGLGIQTALVERFHHGFAQIAPEAFVHDVLVGKLHARHVVVGRDFTFGADQGGDVDLLVTLGETLGFQTHPIDPVEVEGVVVSSTRIRAMVTAGIMPRARLLLGRPFALVGMVTRGAMRGRSIGFGTANLKADNEILPAGGVYAGRGHGNFGSRDAVINIGKAPTFGDDALKVEAHLLDYDGAELYGQPFAVELFERLREEQRFDGVEALTAQIARDVEAAREIMANETAGA